MRCGWFFSALFIILFTIGTFSVTQANDQVPTGFLGLEQDRDPGPLGDLPVINTAIPSDGSAGDLSRGDSSSSPPAGGLYDFPVEGFDDGPSEGGGFVEGSGGESSDGFGLGRDPENDDSWTDSDSQTSEDASVGAQWIGVTSGLAGWCPFPFSKGWRYSKLFPQAASGSEMSHYCLYENSSVSSDTSPFPNGNFFLATLENVSNPAPLELGYMRWGHSSADIWKDSAETYTDHPDLVAEHISAPDVYPNPDAGKVPQLVIVGNGRIVEASGVSAREMLCTEDTDDCITDIVLRPTNTDDPSDEGSLADLVKIVVQEIDSWKKNDRAPAPLTIALISPLVETVFENFPEDPAELSLAKRIFIHALNDASCHGVTVIAPLVSTVVPSAPGKTITIPAAPDAEYCKEFASTLAPGDLEEEASQAPLFLPLYGDIDAVLAKPIGYTKTNFDVEYKKARQNVAKLLSLSIGVATAFSSVWYYLPETTSDYLRRTISLQVDDFCLEELLWFLCSRAEGGFCPLEPDAFDVDNCRASSCVLDQGPVMVPVNPGSDPMPIPSGDDSGLSSRKSLPEGTGSPVIPALPGGDEDGDDTWGFGTTCGNCGTIYHMIDSATTIINEPVSVGGVLPQ